MSSGRWQVITICIFGSVRNSTIGSVALSLSQNLPMSMPASCSESAVSV
jgi:hypothetical protein